MVASEEHILYGVYAKERRKKQQLDCQIHIMAPK